MPHAEREAKRWQRMAFEMSAAKLSRSRLSIPVAIGLANNSIASLMNVSANAVMSGVSQPRPTSHRCGMCGNGKESLIAHRQDDGQAVRISNRLVKRQRRFALLQLEIGRAHV